MKTTSSTEIHGFDSVKHIFDSFEVEECSGTLMFAEYDQQDYEGSAFVLFKRDRKLWEVNGSHCSCMGLEGQWEPTLCTKKSLKMRKFSCLPEAQKFVERF